MAVLISPLPKDMVVEIISWVPADSLVKFKCVSKSWYALITELIDDPAFVYVHLSNTKKQPSSSVVFCHCCSHLDHRGTDCRGDIFSLITILNSDHIGDQIPTISEELNLPLPRRGNLDRIDRWRSAHHCDGILCLVQDPQTIFICNPILQEYRIIPELRSANFQGLGFGYDSRAKDYKVVRIFLDGLYQIEVYSVNDDSWKLIEMPVISIAEIKCEGALYWRGVCYWLVKDWWGRALILCFDMCDEEFHVMDFPESNITNFAHEVADLMVWNDSLALYVCFSDYELGDFPFYIEVFVFDGNSSWTKPFSAGPFEEVVNTFSFIHNNEFLMQDMDKSLVTFNPQTERLSNVVIQDVDRLRNLFCFYVKSLVSVKRR